MSRQLFGEIYVCPNPQCEAFNSQDSEFGCARFIGVPTAEVY